MENFNLVELSQVEMCVIEGGKAKLAFTWDIKYDRNGFSGSVGGSISF